MFDSAKQDVIGFFSRLYRNENLNEIEVQQIRRIFSDTSPLGPLLLLLFCLAGVVLWSYVPRLILLLFMALYVTDLLAKILIVENYKRQSDARQRAGVWRRVLVFGVMYTGTLWGVSTLFLLYPMPLPNLVVMIAIFVLAIFTAIALSRHYLPAQIVGTVLSFLPICTVLLLSEVREYQLLALILALSLCALIVLLRNAAEISARRLRVLAREEERKRIAREIHDGMGGQLMSAIALAEGQTNCEALSGALRGALAEMRLLVNSADGEATELPIVLGLIRQRIEPIIENAGLQLNWQVNIEREVPAFSVAMQLHLTRIMQECVANIIKHANATEVSITTATAGKFAEVIVIDDGDGFYPHSTGSGSGNNNPGSTSGHGVENMRYRAAQIGGELEIETSDAGCVVRIRLPVR